MADILKLQEVYLETENEDWLTELYISIVKLGFTICKKEKYFSRFSFDNEVVEGFVYDVAENITSRLREKKEEIIRQHPSGYITSAIYFQLLNESKRTKRLATYDEGTLMEQTVVPSAEEEFFLTTSPEEIEEEIFRIFDEYTKEMSKEDRETLEVQIYDCLKLNKHYKKYLYKVRRNQETFIQIMNSIEKMLRERV